MIETRSKRFKRNIIHSAIFGFSIIIIIFIISFLQHPPPLHLLKKFFIEAYKNAYRPHPNIFRPIIIANINFYSYIYYATLVTFVTIFIIKKITERKTLKRTHTLPSMILSSLLTIYFFVTVGQTICFFKYFKKELKLFSEETTEGKYSSVLKDIYLLPKHTKSYLPGYHRTKLITGLNIKKDPGAIIYRIFAYLLYPIDIRNIHSNEPFDSVLVYFKENAIDDIPEGYTLYHIFSDESIIAIKEAEH